MSRHLNERQLKTINRIGDCLLPGARLSDDRELRRFSKTDCVSRVDSALDYMPEADLNDLKLLLTIFSYLPGIAIAWVIRLLEWSDHVPTPLGALLRFMRLGLRGLVMTLYYSHPEVHDALEYKVGVYTDDLDAELR